MLTKTKDFTAQFKGIKAEVLALKQAHKYGLNRTDFNLVYVNEQLSKRGVYFKLVIELDMRGSLEPYVDLSSYEIEFLFSWDWDADAKTITVTGFYYYSEPGQSQYTRIGIISSIPIKSYTWEETQQ